METLKPNIEKTAVAMMMMIMMKISILLGQEWGLSKQLPRSKQQFPQCSLMGDFAQGRGFLLFYFKCFFPYCFFFLPFLVFVSCPEPPAHSLPCEWLRLWSNLWIQTVILITVIIIMIPCEKI